MCILKIYPHLCSSYLGNLPAVSATPKLDNGMLLDYSLWTKILKIDKINTPRILPVEPLIHSLPSLSTPYLYLTYADLHFVLAFLSKRRIYFYICLRYNLQSNQTPRNILYRL